MRRDGGEGGIEAEFRPTNQTKCEKSLCPPLSRLAGVCVCVRLLGFCHSSGVYFCSGKAVECDSPFTSCHDYFHLNTHIQHPNKHRPHQLHVVGQQNEFHIWGNLIFAGFVHFLEKKEQRKGKLDFIESIVSLPYFLNGCDRSWGACGINQSCHSLILNKHHVLCPSVPPLFCIPPAPL